MQCISAYELTLLNKILPLKTDHTDKKTGFVVTERILRADKRFQIHGHTCIKI